jgi:acyl carrier protein phosphodiesterase
VNFFAHLIVAAECHDDHEVRFAAMLPDLASMAGVALRAAQLPPTVAVGVALHHRTDEAFHSHRDVLASMGRVRLALSESGMGRGPARAAAHVGHELLFDAALWSPWREHLMVATLGTRRTAVDALAGALGDDQAERIDRLAAALLAHRQRGVPERDGAWIAERIIDLTAHRPRVRVEATHAAMLAAALGDERPAIIGHANAVLVDVVGAVS